MENFVAIGEVLIEVLTKGSSSHIKILKAKELFVELFEVVTGRPTANGLWPDELGRREGGMGGDKTTVGVRAADGLKLKKRRSVR
jgi:hypothetical protein